MPTITNHYTNAHVLNLGNDSGKPGPVIAVQNGVAPGDMTVKQKMFLLCRDGAWVDVVALVSSTDAKLWDEVLFDNSSQVLALLDKLGSTVEVKKIELTAAAIESWLNRTANLDAAQRIQNLRDVYKKRLEASGGH
ncbi:MAG: hypothetical protein K1X78_11250 [Verrucomicrobiaceae bacterium]|nr:hypothetical protein [Verrucomicrobiaceae bacterium]